MIFITVYSGIFKTGGGTGSKSFLPKWVIPKFFITFAAAGCVAFGGTGNGSDNTHGIRAFPELDSLKSVAEALLKASPPVHNAYCETYTVSQVNSCSGANRSTSREVIKPDGSITRFRYRAWNEDGNAVLGEFRGALSNARWKEQLLAIATMRWQDEPGMPDPSLPPAPTQTIQVLTLCDGNRTASFSISGPAPMAIREPMNLPAIFADSVQDTVWALRLETPQILIRKGQIRFTGEWKVWGKAPVVVSWPHPDDPHGCGGATLDWSSQETDEITVNAVRKKQATYAWKVVPGRPTRFELRFPYAQLQSGKKTGKLREFGVLVSTLTGSERIPLTFFSQRIPF